MYVCLCKGITDTHIRTAVEQGIADYRELRSALGFGTQCGKCALFAREIFNDALATIDTSMFYNADTRAVA
ncbi:MAG TPA: bacterioferritin-associated ferredoxin [Spongiibacteraceae bacterium]|nr:bacterioferritin-associated ferredoxin [Spongiibacteraceae bacterium]